ncbi:hypothetical protein [Lacrimispora sp.]|uniref:hypothetical protein n=1 Tax=Lacrimispora sp. TaxID=2719234 RepID=UPI0028995DEC|nr:hypothetical protein [Lacrimispora sp.]
MELKSAKRSKCSFIIIGLLRYDILFLAPATHEMVFNSIEEAVLVVDNDELLINFNHASKRFFPSLAKIKIGDSIHLVHELKDYNFSVKQSINEIHGKILRFKVINIKGERKKSDQILETVSRIEGMHRKSRFHK